MCIIYIQIHILTVGVEEVITSHAGLARHASGDDDNLWGKPSTIRLAWERGGREGQEEHRRGGEVGSPLAMNSGQL